MNPLRPTPLRILAERQHGVVTRGQLLAHGWTAEGVNSLRRRGALVLLYDGVYAVGHAALRDEGRWLAAVWGCGKNSVLSHHSAARLHGRWMPDSSMIHVTTTGESRDKADIRVHRTRRLTGADVTTVSGIPVTTLPRTVVDLADVLTFDELRAFADRGARLDERAIRAAMARHPGRRGARTLRRLVGDGDLRTRSWLERRMRRLCREHGLPPPLVNEKVLGLEVDFQWPAHRLVVEADGHAHHAHRSARARDHRRDARVQAHGWRVVRVLWDDLEHAPEEVAERLAAFLAPARGIA